MREYCECMGRLGVFLRHRGHVGKWAKSRDKKHTQCPKCHRALVNSRRNLKEELHET